MKSNFDTFPRSRVLSRTFFVAVAALALSMAPIFAGVVSATYTTGAEVPVSSNGFTATGNIVSFTLNYAPAKGSQLMVVQNTGRGSISGTFSDLAQGQTVALSYGGVTYNFVANYYGGKGNDLVLLCTGGAESLSAADLRKLDAQIVLAFKKDRGEPPFDKPTSIEPDIPIRDAGRVLVDIEASISRELLDEIALVGGQVIDGAKTAASLRAMVPLSQLETLAGRADVKSIFPARLTIRSRVEASPAP